MKPRPVVIVATVAVIALIAFVPVLLRGPDVGEPAATTTPAAPITPTPTGSPSPTDAPSPGPAEPTGPTTPGDPVDGTAADPPEGRAVIADEVGDLTDTEGEPAPAPAEVTAAADLVGVTLDADGTTLVVTFELAGPVPGAGPHSLLWSVDLFEGEEQRYSITVQQVGARRVAGVLDWESLEQVTPPDPAEIEGTRVRVDVPLELMPDLPAAFTWQALGQLDGGYEDRAPQEGRAQFPEE
jgi:hypothetical protein